MVDSKRLVVGALLGVEGAPKKEEVASLGGSEDAGGGGAPKKLEEGRAEVDAAGFGCPKPPKVMAGPGAALDRTGAGGGAPHPLNDGAAGAVSTSGC